MSTYKCPMSCEGDKTYPEPGSCPIYGMHLNRVIAMGTGTDVAMESSSITLVKGDLMGISKSRVLSTKVMTNIKQNLFFAFVYNGIGIPIAALGLLNPMFAGLAMSVSSVSVLVNALRLKGISFEKN